MLLSDGRIKIEDYTENFPENCQSWPNPNNIQVLLTLKSALPLDWGINIEEPTNHHFPENHPSWSTPENVQVVLSPRTYYTTGLKSFTENFSENLIEHREYWDNPGIVKTF